MQISIKLTLILSFSTCLNLCGITEEYRQLVINSKPLIRKIITQQHKQKSHENFFSIITQLENLQFNEVSKVNETPSYIEEYIIRLKKLGVQKIEKDECLTFCRNLRLTYEKNKHLISQQKRVANAKELFRLMLNYKDLSLKEIIDLAVRSDLNYKLGFFIKRLTMEWLPFKTGRTGTLLDCACNTNNVDAAQILLLFGMDPATNLKQTSLFFYCQQNLLRNHSKSLLEKLILLGCDVNQTDYEGRTPLSYAIEYFDLPLAKALIESGASMDVPYSNDRTTSLRELIPEIKGDHGWPLDDSQRKFLVEILPQLGTIKKAPSDQELQESKDPIYQESQTMGTTEEFIKDTFLHTYPRVELNKCVESYFKKTISENTLKKLFSKFYNVSMTEEDRKLRRIWACNSMLQGTEDTLELFKRFINIGKHLNEGFLLQDGYHKMYHKSIFGLIKYIYSSVRKKKYEDILKLAQKVLEFNKVLVSKS